VRSTRALAAVALAALVVLGAPACSSEDRATGETTSSTRRSGASASGLPDGFPTEVPQPAGATLTSATTTGLTYSATYELTGSTPDAAVSAYEAALTDADFTANSLANAPVPSVQGAGKGWSVLLTASPDGTDTVLTLSVAPA
jgi:hypothetical protein